MSTFLRILTVVVLAILPALALAQEREKMSAVGELKGLKGNVMHIQSSNGEQWLVQAPKEPGKLMFQASAEPTWLQKGMWVQFTAKFDEKGVVHGGVNQVLVITPNKETKIGVNRESDLSGGATELFRDDEPVQSDVETALFTVIGRVSGLSAAGELSVAAGRTPVRVKLSDKTQVAVSVQGLQLAKPGDKVSVEGWYYPQQPNQAYGNEVTVTAQGKLGAKPEAPKSEE